LSLVQPFEEASDLMLYFPPTYVAFSVATMVMILIVTVPIMFIGVVLIKDGALRKTQGKR